MSNTLESPVVAPPTLRQLWADFGPRYAANGFIGWLFAATAPVAIILSVGSLGGFSEAQLASWLFGAFFVNGLITIAFCWL
jgi:benzoate membrane transport protein